MDFSPRSEQRRHRILTAGRALAGRRAGMLALAGIVLLTLVVRLAFSFRAPPFVTNDSLSYLLPGHDLIHGLGFAPILKRPPLYSLFIGGVMAAFGEDLRVLMLVQHLLGAATVLLTYGIGRLLFGPGVGLIGALLTALSGPMIVTEHYLMSEGLFTFWLLAGILAYLAGIRSARLAGIDRERARSTPGDAYGVRLWPIIGWLALAGTMLGLAALTRPIAQATLTLLILGLPVLLPRWRAALLGGATMIALFGIVVLPWMARNQDVQGTFAIAGGSGEGLAVRTIRYEQKFDFREPPGGDPDRLTSRARRIYRDEAEDGSAFELASRLREELDVSEIEAERLMRSIALQAIQRQPGYYLTGTADMLVKTFAGRPVRLRQDWQPWRNIAWEERVQHLLPEPTAVEERSFGAAERLATLHDPARVAPLLALLALLGVVAGALAGRRPVLLVGLLVAAVLVAGAALIGIEYRYRYPLDPLINVLAAGGLLTLPDLVRSVWRRATPGRADRPLPTPAETPS